MKYTFGSFCERLFPLKQKNIYLHLHQKEILASKIPVRQKFSTESAILHEVPSEQIYNINEIFKIPFILKTSINDKYQTMVILILKRFRSMKVLPNVQQDGTEVGSYELLSRKICRKRKLAKMKEFLYKRI